MVNTKIYKKIKVLSFDKTVFVFRKDVIFKLYMISYFKEKMALSRKLVQISHMHFIRY